MCEDLDNMEGLHHLYDIFKNVFLLNKVCTLTQYFSDLIHLPEGGGHSSNIGTPHKQRHHLILLHLSAAKAGTGGVTKQSDIRGPDRGKIIDLLGGQIEMSPLLFSPPFLPAPSLSDP